MIPRIIIIYDYILKGPGGWRFLPLVRVVGLLLHDLQDLLAGVGAILGVAVDGDGFLQRADIVLAVHINSGARHLRDLSYGGTLSADYRAYHVGLDEDAQREIGLATGTR